MANMCTFNLRVFGTRLQRDEVVQYVMSRIKTTNGRHFVNSEGGWAELWPENNDDAQSVCQQFDDELLIEGQSKHVPGLHLANELSTKFPDVKIHIGGSDEEGYGELWELIGGDRRLLDRGGPLTYRELGFGVGYWLVRDGQEVSQDQRLMWIAEEIANVEASDREEFGTEYTAEQTEHRQAIIQQGIDLLEESIRRDVAANAASVALENSAEADPADNSAEIIFDEQFLKSLEEMESAPHEGA